MKKKTVSKEKSKIDSKILYPALIFAAWLISYIICQFVFPHNLAWDEVAYLSVGRGIAENFDFGARSYTVMGLLNYGYPTHLIHYPLCSLFIALFFKLFGSSLTVGYLSTWVAALGVCLLIYFIFLLLSENNHKLSFLVSMSYLFFPSILKNCDSGMMEQFANLLLCLFVYLILRDYVKGNFNYLTLLKFVLSFLVLWLYKTIYVGYLFGAFVLICMAYISKITGKKLNTKIPLPVFLGLAFSIFAVLFYVFKNYVFYPLAPMVNFSAQQEARQVYAEFLGGAFNNFPHNILSNLHYFFTVVVKSYFIYPTTLAPATGEYASFEKSILATSCCYVLDGVYFLGLILMILFAVTSWSKLKPQEKLFISFSFTAIITVNLIMFTIMKTYHENLWRYNTYYLPLYLCSMWILLKEQIVYFKPFISEHPRASKALVFIFFIFLYLPLFISSIKHYIAYEYNFHMRAKFNAEIVKSAIKNEKPEFIYFNDGIHSTFTDYPIKQVFKDATNEQLLKVNKILPKPIEYLFLRPGDWLFNSNQEQILKGLPILNEQYVMYGFQKESQTVIYKLANS